MARRRYVVAYDIREDMRLRRVADVAKDYGHRLQYSVFICDLSQRELLWLKRDLGEVMNLAVDSVAIIDLGEALGRGAECVEFLGFRPYDLPEDDPLVW